MSDARYWNWQTPSASKVLRNGQVVSGGRTLEQWQFALRGHVKDAHAGGFKRTCSACLELRKRIEAFPTT